jgi:hypothetical protein
MRKLLTPVQKLFVPKLRNQSIYSKSWLVQPLSSAMLSSACNVVGSESSGQAYHPLTRRVHPPANMSPHTPETIPEIVYLEPLPMDDLVPARSEDVKGKNKPEDAGFQYAGFVAGIASVSTGAAVCSGSVLMSSWTTVLDRVGQRFVVWPRETACNADIASPDLLTAYRLPLTAHPPRPFTSSSSATHSTPSKRVCNVLHTQRTPER